MNVTIEVPQIEDFKRVNELAKQVHELHVNWNPDLFLSVDNESAIKVYERFGFKVKNIAYMMKI